MSTKTTPKNESTASATGAFPWIPEHVTETWSSFAREQLAGLEAMSENLERLGSLAADRVRENVDEAARLGKAYVDYGTTVAAEWRKLAAETVRRATEPLQKG